MKRNHFFIFIFSLTICLSTVLSGPFLAFGAGVSYQGHVAYDGWLRWVSDGETAGYPGSEKQMEAIRIQLSGFSSSYHIDYQAHVAYDGWQDWVSDGQTAGTTGETKAMETIKISLRGFPAVYHVKYRAYVQGSGWQSWVEDGSEAGTTGQGKAIEAIQIQIYADIDPKLYISKYASGPWGTSASLEQLKTFYFKGEGLTPNSTASLKITGPDNLSDTLNIDNSGQVSWTYTSVCTTPTGTYSVKLVDDSTGKASNYVYETITESSECVNAEPTAKFSMTSGGKTAYENQTLNLTVSSGEKAKVNFSASRSSDPDGSIAGYEWKISGDKVSTSRDFSFSLEKGTHDIYLTVTDDDGAEDSVGGTVKIQEETVNQSPEAKFSMASGGKTVYENQTLNLTVSSGEKAKVNFSASKSSDPDGSIAGYEWKISGDKVSTSRDFSFSLEKGTHDIYLTVTDDDGAEDSVGGTVKIEEESANQSPEAKFSMTSGAKTAYENETLNVMVSSGGKAEVDFSASRSSDPDGSISSYEWKISGKQVSTSKDFSFSLEKGTHDIYLTVTDDDGAEDSVGGTVKVEEESSNESPQARFTMTSGGQTVNENETLTVTVSSGEKAEVNFSASKSSDPDGSISSYEWKINGSQVSSSRDFSHSLDQGTHDIYLTVTDDDGAEDSVGGTVKIQEESTNQSPEAKFSMTSGGKTAYENETLNLTVWSGEKAKVNFSASRSTDPDGSIAGYEWKINGDKVSRSKEFSFSLGEGTHEIYLTVTDNDGVEDSVGASVVVTEDSSNQAPTARFSMTSGRETAHEVETLNLTISSDETVQVDFSASTSSDPDGSISSYEWKISQKKIATSRDFSFWFGEGTHQILLTVRDKEGAGDSVGAIVIVTKKYEDNLDSLVISPIDEVQTVNTPFIVEIKALDAIGNQLTTFSGEALLTCNVGETNPSRINIEQGFWNGEVTVLSSGEAKLTATCSGTCVISNTFFVSGPGSSDGIVQGKVFGTNAQPLSDATVFLQKGSDQPSECMSNKEGYFEFTGLTYAEYRLWASFGDNAESQKVKVQPKKGQPVFQRLLVYTSSNPNGLTPILLVPGMLGSTIGGERTYPTLPKDTPSWDDSRWNTESYGLFDPLAIYPGWGNLILKLWMLYGYDMNVTLFAVPWDWRKDIGEAAKEYLMKRIDLAKEKAGTQKVHIIAHSMGGLVTRWYIQNNYRDDIDRFAMVGTPNKGSANPYYMWFGGDPWLADELTGTLHLYSKATERLYDEMFDETIFYDYGNYANTTVSIMDVRDKGKVRDFYHKQCRSLRTLLPTYSFLIREGHFVRSDENETLNRLNEDFTLNGVTAKIFAGKKKDTIEAIHIGKSNSMYTEGVPVGKPDRPKIGDGTVPLNSVRMGSVEVVEREAKHGKLIYKYVEDLISFLDLNRSSNRITKVVPELNHSQSAELAVSFKGPIEAYLIDSSGRTLGFNPSTGKVENGFDAANFQMDSGYGSMNISNPASGNYTLSLKSEASRRAVIGISYLAEDSAQSENRYIFLPAKTIEIKFNLTHAGEYPLCIDHAPAIPEAVRADAIEKGGLKTRIHWDAPDDSSIVGYKVYGRPKTAPFLNVLGMTTDCYLDTGHAWAETNLTPTMLYCVASVTEDGKESFLSPLVSNDDQDHDGLTDHEETTLGTYLNNSDSDGDGLQDAEEKYYGTDPMAQDTDNDTFNDYKEIESGSDPLNIESIPTLKTSIRANGSDRPLTIPQGEPVSIEVSLEPSSRGGETADWWIAANTPFDAPANWYTYVYPGGWRSGINLCVQTGLFELNSYEVLNMVLPVGDYTFYFAIDDPDGKATGPWWAIDSVEVTVE